MYLPRPTNRVVHTLTAHDCGSKGLIQTVKVNLTLTDPHHWQGISTTCIMYWCSRAYVGKQELPIWPGRYHTVLPCPAALSPLHSYTCSCPHNSALSRHIRLQPLPYSGVDIASDQSWESKACKKSSHNTVHYPPTNRWYPPRHALRADRHLPLSPI